MRSLPSPDVLDEILAVQLLLAWAGESPGGGEKRLGWWRCDLVDEEAGGDLWRRLLPRTKAWAGLDAARRAARLVDEKARKDHARRDEMLTLFHFGFELDEALDERLAELKLDAASPGERFPLLTLLAQPFNSNEMLTAIAAGEVPTFKAIPGARQLEGDPALHAASARRLAAVLLDQPPRAYPLAFIAKAAKDARRG